jgi:hypothetical protein
MNYEESVKAVYSDAKCFKPAAHIIIQNDPMWGDYFVFHRREYGKKFHEFEVLSNHCKTEEFAWKNAWEKIEQAMLRKLES